MPSLSAFGEWEFTADREATLAAYARAPEGGSASCNCSGCRNFVAARNSVYPPAFLSFLQSLGIDSQKDGEVYHNARLSPRCHDYGGWFHFVGTLNKTGDFPVVAMSDNFEVWLLRRSAPALATLEGLPLVQVEFHASAVPWLLDEPEAV
ncbi:MAG: hypothetical protein ACTHK2_10665 [Dokdonella sp.]|uniref:hypothetical protein n=1 Tax=Dokdonella sp. TaxID=2291710 RepID=UPI003F7E3315